MSKWLRSRRWKASAGTIRCWLAIGSMFATRKKRPASNCPRRIELSKVGWSFIRPCAPSYHPSILPIRLRPNFQLGANYLRLTASEHVTVSKRQRRVDEFGLPKGPSGLDEMSSTKLPVSSRRQLGTDQISFVREE